MIRMQYKRTILTPLNADGSIQANPLLIPIAATSNGIEAKQSSKVIDVMGNCCGQKVAFGAKEISGSLSGPLTTALAMIVAQHLMGKFDTLVDATTDTWATAQVVAENDIVNHSNGLHSLACTKSGTTAATEPTITGIGKTVVDGTAKWVIVPKLLKGITNTSKKPRAVAIENEFVKDDGTSVFVRYLGVFFSKNTISAKSGDVEMSWNIDMTGAGVEDSLDDGFVPLKDIGTAKEVKVFDDLFTNDEARAGYISYKNGEVLCDYEELSFDIVRKVEASNALACYANGGFTSSAPIVSREVKAENGKLITYADEVLYAEFKNHEPFDADIKMVNGLGGSVKYSFKGVLPNYSNISLEDCMDSKLSPELFVTGSCDGATNPVTVEVVFPSLVDSTGIIAGGYPV